MTSTGSAPFLVKVDIEEGIAPQVLHIVTESQSAIPIDHVDFDFNGDGVVDLTTHSLSEVASMAFTFPVGYNPMRVTFVGTSGQVVYTATRVLYFYSALDKFGLVKKVFSDVMSRLGSGNGPAACRLFSDEVRQGFCDFFASLGGTLGATSAQLGAASELSIVGDSVEITLVRNDAAGSSAYPVLLDKGADGIWRISGM